ncbi:MAG: hypothetical protein QM767_13150 [Anaeromyxobacter sp.]
MSKTTVVSRKDIKDPDKFQAAAGQAATWLAARKRHVAIAGGVAVGALAIILVLVAIHDSRAAAASAATSELLRTVAGTVSAVPLPGRPGPFFTTEEAKQRAIVAEADKVLAAHGGDAAGAMAQLMKGDASFHLGEWDAAAQAYQAFLAQSGSAETLRFSALEGLALVAEGKKDLAAAADAYAKLAAEAPRYADRADMERARVLAAAGKKDEAVALLKAFDQNHKDSELSGLAAQQLTALGAK